MMANALTLILLLSTSMSVRQALSQCTTTDLCGLRNTRGASAGYYHIPRRSASVTCTGLCTQNLRCIVTTYNPTTECCELHTTGKEGTACMALVTDLGSSFWMMKQPSMPCPKGQHFDNDYTCNAVLIGSSYIDGLEWSDESCALIHGPVTGVRIWTSNYIKLFQVRYGQHWAPVHPDEPVSGTLTEILLAPGEVLTNLNARSGVIIDTIQLTSNLRSYPRVGRAGNYNKIMPLKGLLYFSGTAGRLYGTRVTQIIAHREIC